MADLTAEFIAIVSEHTFQRIFLKKGSAADNVFSYWHKDIANYQCNGHGIIEIGPLINGNVFTGWMSRFLLRQVEDTPPSGRVI